MSTSSTYQSVDAFLVQAEFFGRYVQVFPQGASGFARLLYSAVDDFRTLTVTLTLDPRLAHLHLGHLSLLRKAKLLQDCGHHIVIIFADTLLPPEMDDSDRAQRFHTLRRETARLLHEHRTRFVCHSEWLQDTSTETLWAIADKLSAYESMMDDTFREVLAERNDRLLADLRYAYDRLHLDSDLDLAWGSQQNAAILSHLFQALEKRPHPLSALILPELPPPSGVGLMGGSPPPDTLWLKDSPRELFENILTLKPELLIGYMKYLTSANPVLIDQIERQLQSGHVKAQELIREMARWLVGELYTRDEAFAAEEAINKKLALPPVTAETPVLEVIAERVYPLSTWLVENRLISSKNEVRRLIHDGQVLYGTHKITDPDFEFAVRWGQEIGLQIGRKRVIKILGVA